MTCNQCAAVASEVVLVKEGVPVAVGWLCDACFATALEGLKVWADQFDELIKSGCPRDKANEIVIARMSGESNPS